MYASRLVVLALLVVSGKTVPSHAEEETCRPTESHTEPPEQTVEVSPKCAALVLVGGGVAGSAAAVAVTNLLTSSLWLCSVGFCAAGVQAGSLAAWWQSTLPLIASGSLFATLQSIAMGGTAVVMTTSSTAVAGAALGAGASLAALSELCRMVDELEAGSGTAVALQANLELVRGLSRTTTATVPYVKQVTKVVNEHLSNAWTELWEFVEDVNEGVKRARNEQTLHLQARTEGTQTCRATNLNKSKEGPSVTPFGAYSDYIFCAYVTNVDFCQLGGIRFPKEFAVNHVPLFAQGPLIVLLRRQVTQKSTKGLLPIRQRHFLHTEFHDKFGPVLAPGRYLPLAPDNV